MIESYSRRNLIYCQVLCEGLPFFVKYIFSDRYNTPPFSQSLTLRRAFEIFPLDMCASKSRNVSLVLWLDFYFAVRFCNASAFLKSSSISPFSHILSRLVVGLFLDASGSEVVLARTKWGISIAAYKAVFSLLCFSAIAASTRSIVSTNLCPVSRLGIVVNRGLPWTTRC